MAMWSTISFFSSTCWARCKLWPEVAASWVRNHSCSPYTKLRQPSLLKHAKQVPHRQCSARNLTSPSNCLADILPSFMQTIHEPILCFQILRPVRAQARAFCNFVVRQIHCLEQVQIYKAKKEPRHPSGRLSKTANHVTAEFHVICWTKARPLLPAFRSAQICLKLRRSPVRHIRYPALRLRQDFHAQCL